MNITRMGDIGRPLREVEFEPLPEEPLADPVTPPAVPAEPAPRVPVPA